MKPWLTYIRVIVIVVLAVIIVRTLFVTSCFIPSSGMENTLYRGEGVLVGKWSYGWRVPLQSVFGYKRLLPAEVRQGDIVVFNNPMPADTSLSVDSRELYISRCIGTPGDTLMLNSQLMAEGTEVFSPDAKALYSYPSEKEETMDSVLHSLGITDNQLAGYTPEGNYIRSFSYYEHYLITQRLDRQVKLAPLYPENSRKAYPFVVPQKGTPVKIYPWNAALIGNMIVFHEKRAASLKGDTVYVDGKPVKEYTFLQDYYWMVSNDPVNINDSRLFGFVPENHIIGKALRIWYPSKKGRFMKKIH